MRGGEEPDARGDEAVGEGGGGAPSSAGVGGAEEGEGGNGGGWGGSGVGWAQADREAVQLQRCLVVGEGEDMGIVSWEDWGKARGVDDASFSEQVQVEGKGWCWAGGGRLAWPCRVALDHRLKFEGIVASNTVVSHSGNIHERTIKKENPADK